MAVQPGLGQSGPGVVGRDPLGFGLVGCGAIAATYAAAFAGLAEARLVAVTDLDGALAERFAAEHGVVDASGLDNMLAMPEVEAVCVLVPSGLHGKVGLAVAEGGKHVVVEKPIEISLAAARSLIDGAAARGVSLSVISQQRYNPGVQRARRAVGQWPPGALGRGLGERTVAQDAGLLRQRVVARDVGPRRGRGSHEPGRPLCRPRLLALRRSRSAFGHLRHRGS